MVSPHPSQWCAPSSAAQEHRLGRWFSVKEARNGCALVRLPAALHRKPRLVAPAAAAAAASSRGGDGGDDGDDDGDDGESDDDDDDDDDDEGDGDDE